MKRCATCRHWKDDNGNYYDVAHPVDPDTYEPMEIGFKVRRCLQPEQTFCESPVRRDGFALADGSNYFAALYTAEDFGCVLHEEAE